MPIRQLVAGARFQAATNGDDQALKENDEREETRLKRGETDKSSVKDLTLNITKGPAMGPLTERLRLEDLVRAYRKRTSRK